jgi:serine/threonine-protein kinase RsbT
VANAVAETVLIRTDADIVEARRCMRDLAKPLELSSGDLAMVATAVSELARNILVYAGGGTIDVSLIDKNRHRGVLVVAQDKGPGIADIKLAMQDGFSTSNGLGLGLPGSDRLMDEFDLVSEVGVGTTVTAKKWAPG